jgi:hypothetical protein
MPITSFLCFKTKRSFISLCGITIFLIADDISICERYVVCTYSKFAKGFLML